MKQREIRALSTLLTTRSWAKRIIALVILGAAIFVYFHQSKPGLAQPERGQTLEGRIVGIADGDTATLLTANNESVRIRFAFIDAPEKSQPYGQAAKKNLGELIYNQTVSVEVKDKDRYGRTVGQVRVNGKDVNLAQVQAGYAWHYQTYAKKMQSRAEFDAYAQAQANARAARLGLWQDASPTPPWDYRKQNTGNRTQ